MIPAALAPALAAMDRRLDPASPAPVALALSGGSDSVALLHLAHAWALGSGRPLLALTVDHGLYAESATWTAEAGEAACALGVGWRAMPWLGPKPATGLPAAARAARHALLADAAREAGACAMLIGHTADDVAESELIRGQTPAHGRMTQWSPSPAWPEGRGVFLLRPLLSMRRTDLQAWLRTLGKTWLDDPANADPRYARTRARSSIDSGRGLLSPSCQASLRASSAPRLAARLWTPGTNPGETRQGSHAGAEVDAAGGLTVPVEDLLRGSHPKDVLAKFVLCASGRSRPPSGAALARVLMQISEGETVTGTLGGARLRCTDGRLRVTRELGRRPPEPLDLPEGAATVFDGRFELAASAPGLRVTPVAGHAAALCRADRDALRAIPADCRPALPVLLEEDAPPRLPEPFGTGPAEARPLAAARLPAALGGFPDERAVRAATHVSSPHGVRRALILS